MILITVKCHENFTACAVIQMKTEGHKPSRCSKFTDQGFVVNLLPDELVLTQGVTSFSRDGVDGSLLHLLLDGTVKHEQRLPGTLLVGEAETRRQVTGRSIKCWGKGFKLKTSERRRNIFQTFTWEL